MTLHIKDGGVWKDATSDGLQVKDGGVWKESAEGHIKDAGAWKKFHESAYVIQRSLRFNSPDNTYLSRTGVSGNAFKFTVSFWAKVKGSSATHGILEGGDFFTTGITYLRISGGSMSWQIYGPGGRNDIFICRIQGYNYLFRDVSSWFHVVSSIDLTQASSGNVCKFYINGVEAQGIYIQAGTNYIQNTSGGWNTATTHYIGRYGSPSFDGYLAEMHSVDGTILNASSFGQLDANNVWKPIAYTGSYGTNGFYLNFSDNSSVSALGTDSSGNNNNWAPSNLSVTAGAGNDSLLDTPTDTGTDTGAGGEVRGNYCTWNPLAKLGDIAQTLNVSNGNLQFNSSANIGVLGTLGMASGKWYWEVIGQTLTATGAADQIYVGMTDKTSGTSRIAGLCGYRTTGAITNGNGATTDGSSTTPFVSGDIMRFAYDADAKKLFVGKNGSWLNSGDPVAGTGQAFSNVQGSSLFPVISDNSSPDSVLQTNFGQRPFAYTAPSGFKALCTTNLPGPAIADGSTAMDVKLYTGNGSTQTISGLNFSPDFVWVKARNVAYSHRLWDVVRGATKGLLTDGTSAEFTEVNGLTSFNSDGFSVGTSLSESAKNYAAWTWDAGSSTVTNNAGSISSQVRANPSAGFSVVTYTGTGTTATVGHGLGVAPDLVLCKSRSLSIYWSVYHRYAGTTGYLQLNSDAAYNSATMWNPVPNSTTLNFDSNGFGANNGSGQTYVAYCFSPVEGFSSFGKTIGNGNIDGPYVYTGFRPAFVLWKRSNSSSDWYLFDNERLGFNVENAQLQANSSADENTSDILDFYSNGFKLRTNDSTFNGSTSDYIYMAFAEHPFKYARAR
jgi:hypothetical protein